MTLINITPNVETRQPDRCPWCGHQISRSKFLEIEANIREQEQKRSQEAEARLKLQFEQRLKIEREVAEKRATEVAAKQLVAVGAERNEAIKKLQEATAHEAALRKELQEQAKQHAKRILEESERNHREDLEKQRSSLEKAHNTTLLKQQAEYNRLREAGQKKVKELEQQLQRKTAHELGEGAEIDVFDALRDAFQGDLISRIAKVDGGADIMHQVSYKGEVCGRIVYDSKNRHTWHWAYINKLREDQIKAHAEHAFLPSSVFPSGKKELFVRTGVVVVNPARLVDVVSLVREAMIRMHAIGLSMKERATKMTEVYKYITSEVHMKRLREMAQLNDDILELDVKEKKAQDSTWKARGSLIIRLKNVLREDETEINAILERSLDAETI